LDEAVAEGICAYAHQQVAIQHDLLHKFMELWDKPWTQAGKDAEDVGLETVANELANEEDI